MKLLFDFFPILLFFIAYKFYGIYAATVIAIFTSGAQVGFSWLKYRRVEGLHLFTLVMVLLLGGATLLLQNEIFIKWKPTIVNGALALLFLGSEFIGKQPVIQRLMGKNLTLTTSLWKRLNRSWVVFFLATALMNLYVAYHFDTDTWVNFKLFGMIGLTIIFVILQAVYLARQVPSDGGVRQ